MAKKSTTRKSLPAVATARPRNPFATAARQRAAGIDPRHFAAWQFN